MTARSLENCLDENGNIDPMEYMAYKKRKKKKARKLMLLDLLNECDDLAREEEGLRKSQRKRSSSGVRRGHMPMKRNVNGDTVPISPKETIWWSLYIESPQKENKQFCRKFRRRFRRNHDKFLELLAMVKEDDHFLTWTRQSSDCTGKHCSPSTSRSGV